MKTAATPYKFNRQSTSSALSSLLLLYMSFHECQWFAIIPECQNKKMNK